MLVLSRKLNDEVVIGDNVVIKVLGVKGNTVRLGIEAPASVRIVRGELQRKPAAKATITVVHSDPSGRVYTESEPAVLPLPEAKRQKKSKGNPAGSESRINSDVENKRLRSIINKMNSRITFPTSAVTESTVLKTRGQSEQA